MKNKKIVYVKMEGGILDIYKIPRGVVVDVIDHDVDDKDERLYTGACYCKRGGGLYHRHYIAKGRSDVQYKKEGR